MDLNIVSLLSPLTRNPEVGSWAVQPRGSQRLWGPRTLSPFYSATLKRAKWLQQLQVSPPPIPTSRSRASPGWAFPWHLTGQSQVTSPLWNWHGEWRTIPFISALYQLAFPQVPGLILTLIFPLKHFLSHLLQGRLMSSHRSTNIHWTSRQCQAWGIQSWTKTDTVLPSFCLYFHYSCCCSVAKLCLTLWELIDYSTPGFPVLPLSPGVCSNSRLLSRWCHPTISSSVIPFSSCPQSFPASGSFTVLDNIFIIVLDILYFVKWVILDTSLSLRVLMYKRGMITSNSLL